MAMKLWHDMLPMARAPAFRALRREAENGNGTHYAFTLGEKYDMGPQCPWDDCNRDENKWHATYTHECTHHYTAVEERLGRVRNIIKDALDKGKSHLAHQVPAWWHEQHDRRSHPATADANLQLLQQFDKRLGSRAVDGPRPAPRHPAPRGHGGRHR